MSESNFNHQHLGHVISREDVCLQCVQAKLREAQAACAAYEQCLKVIAYGEGKIEDKGEHYCNSLTDARTFATAQLEDYVDNPGAPLLAQLEAADELTKYLEHNEGCALPNSYHEDRPDSCSCGLGELLKKIQKLREAK